MKSADSLSFQNIFENNNSKHQIKVSDFSEISSHKKKILKLNVNI